MRIEWERDGTPHTSDGAVTVQELSDFVAVSERARLRYFAREAISRFHGRTANLILAAVLILAKATAFALTGSVAMLSACIDSVSSFVGALLTRFVRSDRIGPADADHRFGHGKIESLARLVHVTLVTAMISFWAILAAQTIPRPRGLGYPWAAELVTCAAIAIAVVLFVSQRRHRHEASDVRRLAEARGLRDALAINGVVLVGVSLDADLGIERADLLAGLFVVLWIVSRALVTAMLGIDQLMDKEWPEFERQRFLHLVAAHPAALGIHDFRTRDSGDRYFAQFHLVLAPAMSMGDAETVVLEIKRLVADQYSHVELFIHVDPAGKIDSFGDELVEQDVLPRASG